MVSEVGINVTGLDCGLGVLKTCRREAVAGTERREPQTAVTFATVLRMSAGWGAEGGMTVIAATAAKELSFPRMESSKMFIRENRSISVLISIEGRRIVALAGNRNHFGAPKFIAPFLDGKGSYEHEGGYDDGKAWGGAKDSRGLHEASLIDDYCIIFSA